MRVVWVALIIPASYLTLRWLVQLAMYYPLRYPQGEWSVQADLGANDVWIKTADSVALHGWWVVPRQGARVATLHFHGNAGNITYRALAARRITAAGSAVLLLDYRGYGRSEGRPSEAGLYRDAEAAYEWLVRQGWDPGKIVIHGESLGCAVAVDLAARKKCGAVVLEAPFPSARAVAQTVLPWVGPLLVSGFNTKEKIGRVRAPLLVIHGGRDDIIPHRLGQRVYEAAPEPKSFWTVPGASHNDLLWQAGEEYERRLAGLYASVS